MKAPPKGLHYSERRLWAESSGLQVAETHAVLERLARTRSSAQNHAAELERVEAERDQLKQHVGELLARAEEVRRTGPPDPLPHSPRARLYETADRIRKELGE